MFIQRAPRASPHLAASVNNLVPVRQSEERHRKLKIMRKWEQSAIMHMHVLIIPQTLKSYSHAYAPTATNTTNLWNSIFFAQNSARQTRFDPKWVSLPCIRQSTPSLVQGWYQNCYEFECELLGSPLLIRPRLRLCKVLSQRQDIIIILRRRLLEAMIVKHDPKLLVLCTCRSKMLHNFKHWPKPVSNHWYVNCMTYSGQLRSGLV